MPQRQIPPERQAIYYVGVALSVIGFLTFISVFISGATHFGDFSNFESRGQSMALRGIVGMLMLAGGRALMVVGRSGLAGSGIKLDPEEARRDVEPWSRMSGGVIKDALDEADIKFGGSSANENLPFDERLRRLEKLRQ